MSIALVEFARLARSDVIGSVQTISETRRLRLAMLVRQHGDSLAELNEKIGFVRTDATLSQIRTQAKHSKTGKPRVMGDDVARKIEEMLNLQLGWMDTPPTYCEIHGDNDPRAMIQHMVQDMPPEDWATALRLLSALKKPEAKNGTSG